MKKYKISLKHDYADCVLKLIVAIVTTTKGIEDDDKLYVAGLFEVKERLYKKMANYQSEFTISLTPVQAIAYKMFCDNYLSDVSIYIGNYMLRHSNEIERIYA